MPNLAKKYTVDDPKIVEVFVDNGFLIIKDLFEDRIINGLYNFFFSTTKSNYGNGIVIKSPRHYSVYPIGDSSMWIQSFVMGIL